MTLPSSNLNPAPGDEKSSPGVLSFTPLFLQLLARRGLSDERLIDDFLNPSLSHLHDPFLMKGMREASAALRQVQQENQSVLVHGDYDVDGITGAAILSKTLEMMSVTHTAFLPNRAEDGYGVSLRAVDQAVRQKASWFITVDCGITAHEQIRKAKEAGLKVLVIDHHEIPEEGLPPADIILNPHQADCGYPYGGLSAAGLAFKLSQALLGDKAFSLLDLAALSTVCDVAPLTGENRIIVHYGLGLFTDSKNTGMRALAETSGMRGGEVNTGHLGFVLGPRINAAGRMSSPEIGLRLFLTHSLKEAFSLASVLEEENKTRQREEKQMIQEAVALVERTVNFNRDQVIVVGQQGWHQGVIGIVASRLVDRYHRPAVVIALDGEKGKGSGRSVKKFPLHEAFQACASELVSFGGHAQAAGLTLESSKLESFRRKINEYASGFDRSCFVKETHVDLEVGLDVFDGRFVRELKLLEPHGMGNPKPVFLTRNLKAKGQPQWISPQTLKFYVTDGKQTHEALWTDRTEQFDSSWLRENREVDLAYCIKTKVWNGVESLVLEVKEIKQKL